MAIDLKAAYKTIMDDHFTPEMEISLSMAANGRH